MFNVMRLAKRISCDYKVLWLLILVFVGSPCLQANCKEIPLSSSIEELKLLMESAYKKSPRIQAASFAVEQARRSVDIAGSGHYPTLRGIGEAGAIENEDPLTRDGEKFTIGLEAEQNLIDFDKTSSQKRVAEADVKISEKELVAVSQEILFETISTWLQLVLMDSRVLAHQDHVDNLQNQLSAIEEEIDAGRRRLSEKQLIQSRLARAKVQVSLSKVNRGVVTDKLRILTGRPVDVSKVQNLDAKDFGFVLPQSRQEAIDIAIKESSEILIAQTEVQKAEEVVSQKNSQLYPTLAAKGSVETGKFGDIDADNATILVFASVPLYEGGRVRSEIKAAEQDLLRKRQLLQQAKDKVEQNAIAAWESVYAFQDNIKYWEESLEAESLALAGIEEEVRAGVLSIIEQLKVQDDQLQAYLDTISAYSVAYTESFNLQKVLGLLTDNNLGLTPNKE